ncbi:epsilon-sarcoglycan-like isoform X1 [Lampetra planeri]
MGPRCARAVLLLTLCWLSFTASDQDFYLSPGVTFVHVLDRTYYKRFFPSPQEHRDDPITFHTNLQGFPDRPGWLRYLQRSPHEDGMLYGTPTIQHVGKTVIEVIAYNRWTYDTIQHTVVFNILPSNISLPFQAEFFIRNMNVEELLPSNVLGDFLGAVKAIWQPGHNLRLHALNVSSALDRGGRVPLPLSGQKEGVYVLVGSDTRYSTHLAEPLTPENRLRCSQESQLTVSFDRKFGSQFRVDWCKFILMDHSLDQTSVAKDNQAWVSSTSRGPQAPTGDGDAPAQPAVDVEFAPPGLSLERRDLHSEFVLTTAVPAVVASLLAVALSYLMCCRRQGLQKQEVQTTEEQLVQQCRSRHDGEEPHVRSKQRDGAHPMASLTALGGGGRHRDRGGPGVGGSVPTPQNLDYDSYSAAFVHAQGRDPNNAVLSTHNLQPNSSRRKETSFITQVAQHSSLDRARPLQQPPSLPPQPGGQNSFSKSLNNCCD